MISQVSIDVTIEEEEVPLDQPAASQEPGSHTMVLMSEQPPQITLEPSGRSDGPDLASASSSHDSTSVCDTSLQFVVDTYKCPQVMVSLDQITIYH